MTQDGSKVDVKIRIQSDGSRKIESVIDGEEFTTEIQHDAISGEQRG